MNDVVPRDQRLADDAVRAELQRILGGATFTGAPIVSRLLRYIVDSWLANGGAALKEYAIGVEVLQRGPTFDPSVDTIVRVHARRLRTRLARYYANEGRDDPIRIALPKGHYRPEVSVHDATAPPSPPPASLSICVLPFANMSDNPEQEYLSDGITEDIITDLSAVSALHVVSRNSSFLYKGKVGQTREITRALGVSHLLCGSVRGDRGRIRISACLIDGGTDKEIWAARYDRDAVDIFALNDEISGAIVKALKLRLLPEERRELARRRTDNVEAHKLYLMAKQLYVTRLEADVRAVQAIVRLCERATRLDPNYARAWALLAVGELGLQELGVQADDGMRAVERALALDPGLAQAYATKAYILQARGDVDEAGVLVGIALDLDADSYEANRAAGRLAYRSHRFDEAVRYYSHTALVAPSDLNATMMLVSCYHALGDRAKLRGAARAALQRADEALARDPNNPVVIAYSANALAALGDGERAKTRAGYALLLDSENWNVRYNFACALNAYLDDRDGALEILQPLMAATTEPLLAYLRTDPDLQSLHDDPRFRAMLAAADARQASGTP
ncbi:MAG TPA: hypothetical protein VF264_01310 [Rhodanobacteraceae bacterium]